jgi:hypothetical protein
MSEWLERADAFEPLPEVRAFLADFVEADAIGEIGAVQCFPVSRLQYARK